MYIFLFLLLVIVMFYLLFAFPRDRHKKQPSLIRPKNFIDRPIPLPRWIRFVLTAVELIVLYCLCIPLYILLAIILSPILEPALAYFHYFHVVIFLVWFLAPPFIVVGTLLVELLILFLSKRARRALSRRIAPRSSVTPPTYHQ
jgi:hypothetical protein